MLRLKLHFFNFLAIFSTFAFFSCGLKDLEIPESFSVKTSNTEYNFPLGSGTCLIRDKISASELRETFNENLDENETEVKVYDYNPTQNDDDVLQYLIKYPIKEVPLTISTDGSNSVEISSKIEISNLNSKVAESLKIDESTYTIAETGTQAAIPATDGISFNITSPNFSTMEFYSGYFNIKIDAPSNVSSDFYLIARVILCDTNGNEISSSSESDITNGATIPLSLAGKTVVPEMKIKLSGTMSGGKSGNILSYKVSMAASGLKISKTTGLTMTADEIGDLDNDSSTPNGTVAFTDSFTFSGMNSSLVSAKVAKGSLSIYSQIPDGWSGVNAEVTNISVRQSDDFSLQSGDFQDVSSDEGNYLFNKTADISGKTIKPSSNSDDEIKMSGQVSVSFSNATLIFNGETENPEIEVKGKCGIDEIDTMEISLSALKDSSETEGEVETGLSFSTLLEDTIGEADFLIKNVEFSGIEGYVYAIQPGIDALNGLSYSSCEITANYDDGNGNAATKNLISGDSITLKKSNFDLDSLANNETFTITDSSILNDDNYSAKTIDNSVCELFNAMPDNLKFTYKLNNFSGTNDTITLNQSDVSALENVKSIQLFILIQIPLKFKLSDKYDYPQSSSTNDGYITIQDLRALIYMINDDDEEDLTEDLFDRDDVEDWQDEDKRKYLDLIKSASITYKATNTTNLEIAGQIKDAFSGLDKSLSFENSDENKVLELTNDDIQNIFDNYPFIPVIPVAIKADGQEKTISRNGQFGMSGHVTVKVDGEVEIWSK